MKIEIFNNNITSMSYTVKVYTTTRINNFPSEKPEETDNNLVEPITKIWLERHEANISWMKQARYWLWRCKVFWKIDKESIEVMLAQPEMYKMENNAIVIHVHNYGERKKKLIIMEKTTGVMLLYLSLELKTAAHELLTTSR